MEESFLFHYYTASIKKHNFYWVVWYGIFIGKNDRNQAFFMKKKALQIDHADLTKAVAEQN